MEQTQFGPWHPWSQRFMLQGRDQAGVYLVGRYDGAATPGAAQPLDPSVICIAETHDQSFEGRWKQFEQSAFSGEYGHSPGLNFFEAFMNSTPGPAPAWLHLAVCPIAFPATDGQKEIINDLKRRLLQQYRERHNRLPRCNRVIS